MPALRKAAGPHAGRRRWRFLLAGASQPIPVAQRHGPAARGQQGGQPHAAPGKHQADSFRAASQFPGYGGPDGAASRFSGATCPPEAGAGECRVCAPPDLWNWRPRSAPSSGRKGYGPLDPARVGAFDHTEGELSAQPGRGEIGRGVAAGSGRAHWIFSYTNSGYSLGKRRGSRSAAERNRKASVYNQSRGTSTRGR